MWRLGRTRSWGEQRRSQAAALLLLAPALIWSCGGSSEKSTSSPGAGGAKAGAGSVAGTATVGQSGSNAGGKSSGGNAGSSNAGTAHGGGGQTTGGVATAGMATGAGAGAGGSDAGAGGAAEPWDPELLGFECDSERCSVGQACIRCFVPGSSLRICVPSPSGDPAGFAAATAACEQPLTKSFDECDGPEDCPATRYCVAAEGDNSFMRCRDEPSSASGSCCFACGAATDCTLCRSAADCPDNVACEPAQSAPAGVMGCARRL
jgi:hypothetical protein